MEHSIATLTSLLMTTHASLSTSAISRRLACGVRSGYALHPLASLCVVGGMGVQGVFPPCAVLMAEQPSN